MSNDFKGWLSVGMGCVMFALGVATHTLGAADSPVAVLLVLAFAITAVVTASVVGS